MRDAVNAGEDIEGEGLTGGAAAHGQEGGDDGAAAVREAVRENRGVVRKRSCSSKMAFKENSKLLNPL